LLYPSAAMKCNGDNFAVRPEFVDQNMNPIRVDLAHVKKVGDFKFEIEWLDSATKFGNDDNIGWKGHFDQWRISKQGESLTLTVNELGRWVAHDDRGDVVPPI
jgi:hypothetical protein